MKTKWSHLPNAEHVDRVLASVKAHPEAWVEAWAEAYNAARLAAYDAAYDAAWNAARAAAWDAARGAARGAARAAILALIAWDDCAQYLDMPSDQLKVWAILSENPAAVLLLPAVIAFEKIAELELA
jgi:hypothetical protein